MDRAPYKVHLEVQAVLDAFDQQASSKDLEALEVGPPYPAREVDAVERELTALLPAPMRDFLLRHGRVRAWDVATTIALPKLVAESRSLTETLVRGKKFEPSRFIRTWRRCARATPSPSSSAPPTPRPSATRSSSPASPAATTANSGSSGATSTSSRRSRPTSPDGSNSFLGVALACAAEE